MFCEALKKPMSFNCCSGTLVSCLTILSNANLQLGLEPLLGWPCIRRCSRSTKQSSSSTRTTKRAHKLLHHRRVEEWVRRWRARSSTCCIRRTCRARCLVGGVRVRGWIGSGGWVGCTTKTTETTETAHPRKTTRGRSSPHLSHQVRHLKHSPESLWVRPGRLRVSLLVPKVKKRNDPHHLTESFALKHLTHLRVHPSKLRVHRHDLIHDLRI